MMSEDLSNEIWDRLVRGCPLDDLSLPLHEGRCDLRHLKLPTRPVTSRKFGFSFGAGTRADAPLLIERTSWRNLDFSGANLVGLQLSRMNIDNCSFNNCKAQNIRVWSSTFADCTFASANLKDAVLGGVAEGGARSSYLRVDFSRADLRSTSYTAAAFEACAFRFTNLAGVDFQSSAFRDCVFEGELRDVMFYRHGFKGERFPPNEMINVDFQRAQLHDVSFRGLTLDSVTFPQDDNHVVVEDYAALLAHVIPILLQRNDETARRLISFLEMERQWLPSAKTRAVINLEDLEETVDRQGVDLLVNLLSSVR